MIVLFEDNYARDLEPVALTRHVSHLLVGTAALRTRIEYELGDNDVTLHGRSHIVRYHGAKGAMVERPIVASTFVNARLMMTPELATQLSLPGEWIARQNDTVVAARLEANTIARLNWVDDALDFSVASEAESKTIDGALLYRYLWDLIADNGPRIAADIGSDVGEIEGSVMPGAILVGEHSISIGDGAIIRPGAILDASSGPIVIDSNAEVMSGAVIEGPCYVGQESRIKIGAKIYGSTSIGPACKVGGEVENSIILGFSNKQHDGFLGHSYLGAWVNLGADTNTSDLKNNYGRIRVTLHGDEVDTGRMFLGALVGDHCKTGINTMLNTGTTIGVAANVFGAGFPPKNIPSFAWGGAEGFEIFRLEQAIDLARTVMGRRTVEFTDADASLLTWLAEHSS